MNKFLNDNKAGKHGVVQPTGSAKQRRSGGMVGGLGQPTTPSYTTCPLEVEDDYDEYDEFDDFDKVTLDMGGGDGGLGGNGGLGGDGGSGGNGGWGGDDGIMDFPVATPGSSSTPKATKTKKANAKMTEEEDTGEGEGTEDCEVDEGRAALVVGVSFLDTARQDTWGGSWQEAGRGAGLEGSP